MSALAITSPMRGDSTTLEEDLQRGIRKSNIELLMDQLVRYVVIVVVHFDVIVDIDPGALPFGINIGMNREGFENRFFERFKQDPASTFEVLKGAVIESFQLLCDGFVELTETEEGSVSERSQDA